MVGSGGLNLETSGLPAGYEQEVILCNKYLALGLSLGLDLGRLIVFRRWRRRRRGRGARGHPLLDCRTHARLKRRRQFGEACGCAYLGVRCAVSVSAQAPHARLPRMLSTVRHSFAGRSKQPTWRHATNIFPSAGPPRSAT
jgi:hypothetical protein